MLRVATALGPLRVGGGHVLLEQLRLRLRLLLLLLLLLVVALARRLDLDLLLTCCFNRPARLLHLQTCRVQMERTQVAEVQVVQVI